MTNLDSILKSRDINLPTKVCVVKAMVFPVVMYGCESWTVKTAEHWRIDAFELWCWRRLLRVPWTARRSNWNRLPQISTRTQPKPTVPGFRTQWSSDSWCLIAERTQWETKWWVQFSSVTQSCPTFCNPIDYSMSDFPVHHHLLEYAQIYVHWVGDAIQPSHPLLSPSPPALSPPQHQGLFQWVSCSHQVAKVLEFQLQHQSFQWIFRVDFLLNPG